MTRRTAFTVMFLVPSQVLAFDADSSRNSSNDSSADSSGNSGASSNNSNASSQNSNDSSADSNASSQNSDQSSDQSLQESSRDSSDGTSETSSASTADGGGEVVTAVTAVLLIGGVAVGTGFAIWSTVRDEDDEDEDSDADELAHRVLQRSLRREHPQLVREITVGQGPLLDSWLAELGLTQVERRRFARSLEGSAEQTRLLRTLNGPMSRQVTTAFAGSFCLVLRRAVGERRWLALAPKTSTTAARATP